MASTEDTSALQPDERRGLVSPLRRDGKGDFANATGVDLILNNAEQILGMRGPTRDMPGECPWEPALGSQLYMLRHQNVRAVINAQAHAYVSDALARWEPRLRPKRTLVELTKRHITIRSLCDVFDRAGRGRMLARDQVLEVQLERMT